MAAKSVTEEIKQTRPFLSLAQETTVALLRTSDMVRRRISRVIEPEGITAQQYNVLRILRGAAGKPMCALDIRDRLIEEAPGVSRLIDRLVEKSLVRRDRSTADRRLLECSITEEGLELLRRMDDVVNGADIAMMNGLNAEETATLNELLSKVREGLG